MTVPGVPLAHFIATLAIGGTTRLADVMNRAGFEVEGYIIPRRGLFTRRGAPAGTCDSYRECYFRFPISYEFDAVGLPDDRSETIPGLARTVGCVPSGTRSAAVAGIAKVLWFPSARRWADCQSAAAFQAALQMLSLIFRHRVKGLINVACFG